MRAELVVVFVVLEHVVDDGDEAVAHRHDGLFFADAMSEAVILRREVVVLGARNDPHGLRQHGSQMRIAFVGMRLEAFAATLLVARCHPGPGGEMLGGRKDAHVGAHLGENGRGGERPMPGICIRRLTSFSWGTSKVSISSRDGVDLALQEINAVEQLTQEEAMSGLDAPSAAPPVMLAVWLASDPVPDPLTLRHR